MTPIEFIILSLATWRLSSLLVNEAGPKNMFGKFRTWAGIRVDAYSQPYATGFLSELLMCVWCTSVWVGIGLSLIYWLSPIILFFISLPFALSTMAIITKGCPNGTSQH